jgi:CHAT domain-containing protein/tetratricopeptide (TPR) repeat protein
VCRDQFEEYVLLDRQLEQLKSSEPALHQADCPDLALWRELAAGVTPPKESLAHIQHASRCDHCGPLLREAVAEVSGLNQAMTESERAKVATLASAQQEWQRHLAQHMAGATRPNPSLPPWRKAWANFPKRALAGAALAAVVAAASWIAVHWRGSDSTDLLLARAYTERRTLEVRFRGAAYAPLRVQRGPEASFADRPLSLLKAEALIAGQLTSHPSDPSWLQAKARADLLEGKYDAAVESLRRALELSPDSPELVVDLASAYFQRAQTEDRPQDYGAAFESLSKVLAQRPDDPVALFNRAIISEHQFLYHQALDDWEHYLHVDARSQWADEARGHADAVRTKLQTHKSDTTPLLTPAQLADSPNASNRRAAMDEHIEEYLQDAVRFWLPSAYPERAPQADPAAREALFFLADLTSLQHNDRWLSDLLHGSSAPNFSQAVAALAQAAQANAAGEYSTTNIHASQAERLFRASGNVAGRLRAEFEQTFAVQIERHSEKCRRQAASALAESEKYSYSWLQIQLGLEKGVCSALMGDFGSFESAAQRAMDRAQPSGYGALYLRALGFLADDQFETGDPSRGGRLVSTGLGRYWSGQFPAMRGYNLYTEFAEGAEIAGRPNLQVADWREALALIDSDKDLLLRAHAHDWMANAAVVADQPRIAAEQYAEAARLFALAPQPEATRANRLESEIRLARLEAHEGEFDAALTRLTRTQSEIRQVSNNYLALMFYSTLGEVQLRRQRPVEAEQALRPALRLAEQELASLDSEAERISWSKAAAPIYLAMAETELVQGRAQEALDVFEWHLGAPQRVDREQTATGPANTRPFQPPAPPDPVWLASRLPLHSQQTVITYGLLPDGLAIWVYDDRGVSLHWSPKPTLELQELAARFHGLVSDPSSETAALRRDAGSLYSWIIAPVEPRLVPGRTLVIEADSWLATLPFEALLDSSGHYLIERAPIVHSLGGYSDALLREQSPISPQLPALVVASTGSSESEGLIPLPDIAAEAETVAKGFAAPRVLEGREATLRMVRQQLPGAAVFHFAGHSLATPDKAGLMLADRDPQKGTPTLLDAAVVRGLKLQNMLLAVLSACSTGTGGAEDSSGFTSVTGSLLRAGVPHVVASRWAVDSAETRRFVEDFYRHVLSGQTVSEAIQLSSRNMLSNPRTAHPYYWSAFAAYGRP